ncbi:rhodanese-like domain-containing protein [Xanthomarina gelatinilytica]|uniref:rhodanese-like domain-containing protein n=1 Tax=Xanthomarina gelatinilytica TaxID=1137281 RepID=UPI003AA95F8F
MKKTLIVISAFFLVIQVGFSQDSLSELLAKHNTHKIPYISAEELAMPNTQALILDAREFQEYQVSHIKDAVFVGYNTFNLEQTALLINNKQQPIVVYCSLGIRSETISNHLLKAGYTNVYNLYGGIFEWVNNGFDVYDSKGYKTNNIHAFSPEWSKWLKKGNKVFN